MCAQWPGLAIRWAFLLLSGGTQRVWSPSHAGRIAVIQPGGYKYMDRCDQVYVQYFVFHVLRDFLLLVLFTDSVVLRSPEGPQNCSLIPDDEGDTVSLGSIILVLPEFSFS